MCVSQAAMLGMKLKLQKELNMEEVRQHLPGGSVCVRMQKVFSKWPLVKSPPADVCAADLAE